MNSLVDWFLAWWLRRGRYGWSRLRRRLFEGRYLATALPAVSSLAEIQACLHQVTWTRDGPLHLFDSISYPQTTWVKKRDDCDGFASLAAALLARYDPARQPVLVTAMVRPVSLSHTVCAFRTAPDSLRFFDNDALRPENCRSYAEVVALISQPASRLVCWDVRDAATLEMIDFRRV
ncbi:MAG: hypothetical protein V1780_00495 [Chloroflexota bacterium]